MEDGVDKTNESPTSMESAKSSSGLFTYIKEKFNKVRALSARGVQGVRERVNICRGKVGGMSKRNLIAAISMVAVLGAIGVGVLYWYGQGDEWVPYAGGYRLVPETISTSGFVTVNLPEELATTTTDSITFEPMIQGDFVVSTVQGVMLFKPEEPLTLDSYYRVAFVDDVRAVTSDFRVVEDPKVLSILPTADTETHEDGEISIIFNRPMVPLSTRDILDAEAVPVRLTPPVPGVWKWKSTRLLQFIPEEDLSRATTYTVTVNEGFHSLDGVSVPGFTHSFTTRTLKHQPLADSVRFNAPLEITFNQPVDLERTVEELVLEKDGERIEPIVSYATRPPEGRGFLGLTLFSRDSDVDTTRIWVRPQEDMHGREGYWDFEASYTLSVKKQYPTEGDIVATQPIKWSYTFPTILTALTAVSERSSHVEPTFFDPEGELVATFYESIDLKASKITLEGLREMSYGKQCVTDEEGRTRKDPETKKCVEEDNTKELHIRVDPSMYPRGKEATLVFENVVREGGLKLNRTPITYTVRAVPEFQVLRTIPSEGDNSASVTSFTVCSNTPLERPVRARDVLKTEGYVVYPDNAWSSSYRVGPVSEKVTRPCNEGEFHTEVKYGLHPQKPYRFALSLTDEFTANIQQELGFTTAEVSDTYARFHSLQKWYNVTVPDKTRLTYAVENLPAVVVHMCKVSPETMLRTLEADTLGNALPPAHLCTAVRTATVDLPDTYWVYNYFYFDIKDYFEDSRGHYILTFTHPQYRDSKGVQQYEHTLLSVSNLTVGEKRTNWYDWYSESSVSRAPRPNPTDLYWVLHANTLNPVTGVSVVSYAGSTNDDAEAVLREQSRGVTKEDGVAKLPGGQYTRGAVLVYGGDTAVVSSRTDTLAREWGSGSVSRTYLYTDRPLYRPGDTVHLRGIDRVGYDQSWASTEGYEATVRVIDSKGEEVHQQKIPVSKYGTFNTSLALPDDAPLGTYTIEAMENGMGWFEVEEYVSAPFKVEVTPREGEYTAGETAEFGIEARYYFDMPVADAEVEYTVLAQDYHFDRYTSEYFSFGAGWYSCYWCGYGDEFITRGTVVLDADGKAKVEVPLDFAKYFEDPAEAGSKLFTIIARVKDKSGKQVTAQNTAIVHRGAFYLGVRTDPYIAGKGEDVSVRVKSVDTQGVPIALSDTALVAERVEWESYQRREVDGGYYWHTEETYTPVETRTVRTDKDGNHTATIAFAESGSYRIRVERDDELGNPIRGETQFYVWGTGDVSMRPTNNASLTVVADKPSYNAGETATILAESPFKEGRALVTVERGDVYEHWSVPVEGGFIKKAIPLTDAYTPTVYASVLLVGPGPEVKHGSVPLTVDTDAYTLDVEAIPDKKAYLPGEDVVLTVRARDAKGAPVSAEVSVAVVDLSVLALVGNPKKDPVSFFYGGVSLGVSTAHSAKNMLVQTDIPTGTKGGGGGEDLERRKRGTFKDTAYWSARVVTNESGEATVRFTLPDNLTTWQIESLGVTQDTRLGVHYTEFTSKKRLMAIPIRPRFVVPGDSMSLGMQVMNNTEDTVTVRAHITSETLMVQDTEERTVQVKAGAQEVVYFDTVAPTERKVGTHVVTFHAQSSEGEDVVEQVVPIRENKAYEVTATAGMTEAGSVFESLYVPNYALPGQGELTVRAQPTLVGSFVRAVGEMAQYPYGCSEQIASQLASLSTVRRVGVLFGPESVGAVQGIVFGTTTYSVDEAVEEGLGTLLGRQGYDGGFSFYGGTDSSPYLTVEVLSALTVVRDAGYQISDDVFVRAGAYLTRHLSKDMRYIDHMMVARTAYALASPYIPVSTRDVLRARVEGIMNDSLVMERLDTTSLAYLALATTEAPYGEVHANTFFKQLENRIVVDARGAYVRDRANEEYGWFSSAEKNTALFVRAVAKRGGNHATLDNTLRWLQRGMGEKGGWGSTNTTFTVLDAVLRLSEVRKEHGVAFDLSLSLNESETTRYSIRPDTLFDVHTYVYPLDVFTRERIHRIALSKEPSSAKGTIYYDMQLRYALPPELLPPRDEGFTVERTLTVRGSTEPLREAKVGDIVTGRITVTVPKVSRAVSVESFVPAGFEIVNMRFATEESRDLAFDEYGNEIEKPQDGWWYDEPNSGPRAFPVSHQELHDDRVFLFTEEVYPGTYVYEYTLRALVPGTYVHMPATVSEMYTPEIFGRSDAGTVVIKRK